MIQVGDNVGFDDLDQAWRGRGRPWAATRGRKMGRFRRRQAFAGMGATINTLPLYANIDAATPPAQSPSCLQFLRNR